MLTLRLLNQNDEAAFIKGMKEWEGESPHWYAFNHSPQIKFSDYVSRLDMDFRGEDLPPGRVAHSMLYAFLDGDIIGRVSVRHELNEYLRRRGGHIGYAVAPRFRRQGHATEMLKQALRHCHEVLHLERVMITCDDRNEASWRLLEKFGARLEEKFFDHEDQSLARRYWLDVPVAPCLLSEKETSR